MQAAPQPHTYAGFYANRSVLITGGLGFIGSNLALRLVDLGAKVTLLDRELPDTGANPYNIESIRNRVEVVIADIGDRPKVDAVLQGKDLIFNLAGTLSHTDSMRDPFTDLHCNCTGHVYFLEACRAHAPKARILYAATRAQYGRLQHLPVDEFHPLISADVNGINKTSGEAYHLLYGLQYDMFTTSLRLTNTYGPRHQMRHARQGVLNWLVRRAVDNDPICIFGDGTQIRDVNYVDDVTEAMLATLANDKSRGEIFNLGGHQIRLKDLGELLVKLNGGGEVQIVPYPKNTKDVEIGDYVADTRKIESVIGWKARVGPEEGFLKTLQFYREHQKQYWTK